MILALAIMALVAGVASLAACTYWIGYERGMLDGIKAAARKGGVS